MLLRDSFYCFHKESFLWEKKILKSCRIFCWRLLALRHTVHSLHEEQRRREKGFFYVCHQNFFNYRFLAFQYLLWPFFTRVIARTFMWLLNARENHFEGENISNLLTFSLFLVVEKIFLALVTFLVTFCKAVGKLSQWTECFATTWYRKESGGCFGRLVGKRRGGEALPDCAQKARSLDFLSVLLATCWSCTRLLLLLFCYESKSAHY